MTLPGVVALALLALDPWLISCAPFRALSRRLRRIQFWRLKLCIWLGRERGEGGGFLFAQFFLALQ